MLKQFLWSRATLIFTPKLMTGWWWASDVRGGQEGEDDCGLCGRGDGLALSVVLPCAVVVVDTFENLIKTRNKPFRSFVNVSFVTGRWETFEEPLSWGRWDGEWGQVLIPIGDKGGQDQNMSGGVLSCFPDSLEGRKDGVNMQIRRRRKLHNASFSRKRWSSLERQFSTGSL